MRKIKTLLVLSILISIMPYLGFPYGFKNILISILGLTVLYIGFALYSEDQEGYSKKETFENFSENNDFVEVKTELLDSQASQ